MIPVNQVILGGGDPLLGNSILSNNLEEQIQLLEKYKQNLESAKQINKVANSIQQPQKLIWDDINAELEPLTTDQKNKLYQDEEYMETYNQLQTLVNNEILNLVKGRIESTEEGRSLLQNQLKIVKKLKGKIIEETNKEMELFKKFKEYSKNHPEVTYDEFIKSSI